MYGVHVPHFLSEARGLRAKNASLLLTTQPALRDQAQRDPYDTMLSHQGQNKPKYDLMDKTTRHAQKLNHGYFLTLDSNKRVTSHVWRSPSDFAARHWERLSTHTTRATSSSSSLWAGTWAVRSWSSSRTCRSSFSDWRFMPIEKVTQEQVTYALYVRRVFDVPISGCPG